MTDSETGEFVAFALWRLQLEEEKPQKETSSQAEVDGGESKHGPPNIQDPRTTKFWADTARRSKKFKDESVGTRPHACKCQP